MTERATTTNEERRSSTPGREPSATVPENPHRLKQVFEGAEVVKVDEGLNTVAVWSGGTGINLYSALNLEEQTVYNISDENGEYLEADEIEEHIEELFEHEREKRFDL